LYASSDEGESWNKVTNGFWSSNVLSLAIDGGGNILAGTYDGVFVSDDGGESWDEANSGLTPSRVTSLSIDSEGFFYAGTEGAGLFRTTVPLH
jgi:ligand-binding sensor domain-containing protein